MGLIKISKPKTALCYAVGMWVIGFVWGLIVFMIPPLKAIPAIPYLSKFPAVSAPLIVVYTGLLVLLTRKYLVGVDNGVKEAVAFGIVLVLATIILDTFTYVIMFKSSDYFTYASIWTAYALFILVPWLVGRAAEEKREAVIKS
jgi:hypothetical protein